MDPQQIKIMNRQSRSKRHSNGDLGAQCVKFLVFTTNLLFILTGAALIVTGIILNSYLDRLSIFLQDNGKFLTGMLAGFGVLILLVSAFGCIGGMKSSTAWMNIYGLLLVVTLVLEIMGAAFYFSHQRQVEADLLGTMKESMKHYETDSRSADAWDYLQREFYCCGIYDQNDWNRVLVAKPNAVNTTNYYNRAPLNVPDSCCSSFNSRGDCDYTNGGTCYRRLDDMMSAATVCITIGVAALVLVQVLGAVCALKFAKNMRLDKSMCAAGEWKSQATLVMDKENNMPVDNEEIIDTDDDSDKPYRLLSSSLSCACISASCMVSYTKPGE